MVAVLLGEGAHTCQVGTCARFGHGEAADGIAGVHGSQVLLLLLFVAELSQVRSDQVVENAEGNDDGATVSVGKLLVQDLVVAEVHLSAAAVCLRSGHTNQTELAGLLEDLAIRLAFLVPALYVRGDFLLDEAANHVAEHVVLFFEVSTGQKVLHDMLLEILSWNFCLKAFSYVADKRCR